MSERYWAVVPAAGIGRRVGGPLPKQYLKLLGTAVLVHTLRRIAGVPEVEGIVVALAADDPWWDELDLQVDKPVRTVVGGAERAHSVAAAVAALCSELCERDWILVHDAARPCVRIDDIRRLIGAVRQHPCGGLLASPVHDTVKQAGMQGEVVATVDRSRLWRALTPQLFRAPLLHAALQAGLTQVERITDEASAMELAGHRPLLVEGSATNIKITRAEDLALASFYLSNEASLS